jgi:DNA-binding IclR family transcriptional regulator
MTYLSHDILVPHRTVELNPLAVWRDPGHLYDSPRSAIRALQILELLATAGRPLRAVEITKELALSPSSAIQLLKIMMDWAYLVFDPFTKRYYPSPLVARLSGTLNKDYCDLDAVNEIMATMLDYCGGTVSLSISQGSFMQVVQALPDLPTQAMHVPLFGSCSGAAWLARQPDSRIRSAIRLCRRELGRQADNVPYILEQINRVRAQGYAFGGMFTDDHSRGLAVALPVDRNGIVLVMSMTGKTEVMKERRDEIFQTAKGLIEERLRAATSK